MDIRLYNTLTRTKEAFRPLDWAPDSACAEADRRVRMYVCGPTVYDFAHIGNARPLIVFDVLFRLLRHVYGADRVLYVRNITDVDDKINARAAERLAGRGVSDGDLNAEVRALTDETYRNFKEDVAALGCLPPTEEPRATEFIRRPHSHDMIGIIERLIEKRHAYVADGHVLFHVPSMPDYGALSRRPLDEMIAGARIEVAPYKRDPQDFVLWKPSTAQEPGWDSPWGRGRPGWHIECSAMSAALLGETFDIHGGGIDLMFPHHENEIAQSRCAFGTPAMAQIWMHNGFLQVEGEKMSKSLGNFVTIRELLTTGQFGGSAWDGNVLRLAMLSTHYRQPIDWTTKTVVSAAHTLEDWFNAAAAPTDTKPPDELIEAVADDLNSPAAITFIHALRKRVARNKEGESAAALGNALAFLGFEGKQFFSWLDRQSAKVLSDLGHIEKLVTARTAARAAKNWAESDRIRDELATMGVALKDSKDGTTWEVAR